MVFENIMGIKRKRPVKPFLAVAYFPQGVASSVSSVLERFTAVFGMGTGGTTLPEPPGRDLIQAQFQ